MVQTNIPTLDNAAETYEELTDTLKRRLFPPPPPAIMQGLDHAQHPPAVHYDASITIEQIQRAVHKVAADKGPGPDEITNRVLKLTLSPLLFMYYNADLLEIPERDMALGFIDDIVYGTAGPTARGNLPKLKRLLDKAHVHRSISSKSVLYSSGGYVFSRQFTKPSCPMLGQDLLRVLSFMDLAELAKLRLLSNTVISITTNLI
jgi:hypothetical protein